MNKLKTMIPVLALAGAAYTQNIPTNDDLYKMARDIVPSTVEVHPSFAYVDPASGSIKKANVANISALDKNDRPIYLVLLPTQGSGADSAAIYRSLIAPIDPFTGEKNNAYAQVVKADTKEQLFSQLKDAAKSYDINIELNPVSVRNKSKQSPLEQKVSQQFDLRGKQVQDQTPHQHYFLKQEPNYGSNKR